jgi:hypothetical protein
MSIKNITVIVEPLPPGREIIRNGQIIRSPRSIHEDTRYIQLVEELKECTSANVTLVEDFLPTAPARGIVLLYPTLGGLDFEQSPDHRASELGGTLAQRLVLLNVYYGVPYHLVAKYPLPALVEFSFCSAWWDAEQQPGLSIFGLATVGEAIEASCRPGGCFGLLGEYCPIAGEKSEPLPSFLLRYLEAYVRIVPGMSELDL